MNLKPRPDDRLGNLPQSDQQRILAWLANKPYREVKELVGKPAPDGFDIQTSITALANFYVKNTHQQALEFDVALPARGPDPNTDGGAANPGPDLASALPAALEETILSILQQKAFHEVVSPHTTFSENRSIANFLLRRAGQKIREQESLINDKKLGLDVRRVEVIEHYAGVGKAAEEAAAKEPRLTPEERTARYREIFGLDPLPPEGMEMGTCKACRQETLVPIASATGADASAEVVE